MVTLRIIFRRSLHHRLSVNFPFFQTETCYIFNDETSVFMYILVCAILFTFCQLKLNIGIYPIRGVINEIPKTNK